MHWLFCFSFFPLAIFCKQNGSTEIILQGVMDASFTQATTLPYSIEAAQSRVHPASLVSYVAVCRHVHYHMNIFGPYITESAAIIEPCLQWR